MKREVLKQAFIPLVSKIERLTTNGKDTQPDYSTVIKITQERLLRKGDCIQLAVWENDGQLKMRMIKLEDDELKKFNLLYEEE